jgi:hypothetical protein
VHENALPAETISAEAKGANGSAGRKRGSATPIATFVKKCMLDKPPNANTEPSTTALM